MKKNLLFSLVMLTAGSLLAADANSKDDVTAAASAVSGAASYSWHTITDMGPNAQFTPGPVDGKTEKDGYTMVTMSFNDNTTEILVKGTNSAVKTPDNGWQTAAEASQGGGGGGFNAGRMATRMAQNKKPADQAAALVGQVGELKAGDDGITGDLTEEGAKSLMTFGRRGGNASNAKGSVTFWITDGKLVKFKTHVTGTVSFNGNDRDVDRTTTTEIKDIGSTKVEVPDDAKKKLE
jgi:hypothetical protein